MAFGSFEPNHTSTDVRNIPDSSTVNVCARGSLYGALINCWSTSISVTATVVVNSLGLAAGGGGFLTPTVDVSWVRIVPVPL